MTPNRLTTSSDSRPTGVSTPLCEDRDEIRVLTLEAIHDDGLAKPESTRHILGSWIEACLPQIDHHSPSSHDRWKRRPHARSCRFAWGDFAALSYVWGTDNKECNIVVNGTTQHVTRNLDEALRRLAQNAEFRGEYKIWIDALCINQADVRKMRQIYSSAWTVIAWLGESDAERWIPKAFVFSTMLASLEDEDKDLRMLCDRNSGIFTDAGFVAVHNMMCHPYWSRLWIIQEVVMGASCTVLRCGDHHLSWDTLCKAIADDMLRRAYRRGISSHKTWTTKTVHLVHLDLFHLSHYEDKGAHGERLGFRHLLELAISSDCLEARDKIFALTGMMETEIANDFVKAYSLDVPHLFAAITHTFIKHYDNLKPLRQGNPWGPQRAPTWAADWTWQGRLRWSRPETGYTGPLWDFSDPNPRPEEVYNAHGGQVASYFLPDSLLLHCQGFIFDEVTGLGARESGVFDWLKETVTQCFSWKRAYGNDRETAQALSRLLLGGSVVGRQEQAKGCYEAILSLPSTFEVGHPQFLANKWSWLEHRGGYYYKWSGWRESHDHLMLGKRRLGSFFTNRIPDEVEESAYTAAFVGVDRTVKERRFMLTRSGRFGWAPDNANDSDGDTNQVRIGDLIAIVYGCSTPLAIRRIGEQFRIQQFQILGEAYVEGVMNGEALEFLKHGSCKQESFVFY
ncbi:HET-domain-containing protein [Xylariaceae sp. FL0255]|nr:HET-domain-containing protein [Xylariaceae sp. FL0255]